MPKYQYKSPRNGGRCQVGGTSDGAPRGNGSRDRGPCRWSIDDDVLACAGFIAGGVIVMIALMAKGALPLHDLFGAMGAGLLIGMGAIIGVASK